ncbi:hypothetical protein [Mesoterricola silvestris]|uniref:Tetratricopeptide repeat protein n=1 Tax=Mesoterricola silvestris TaxID=2927979 RepID=A0AA48KBU3_9BACT|nr:hypothetical protein [Mesoterricola silvestris]BDU74677.1 hypothetical protein METEAL_38510 [Mesoterricola silvestris]
MNPRRYLPAAVAALVLALAAVPIIRACAPEGPSLAFTWATHPDLPLNAFAEGSLGILQPTYARSYLVVAYRQMAGLPLTQAERRSVLELWNYRLQGGAVLPRDGGSAPQDPAAAPSGSLDWKAVRARFTREPAPDPVRFRWDEDAYRPAVSDSALEVAAATLLDRSRRWDPDRIADWIRAQDRVFSTTGKTGLVPEPAPAGRDPLFQADRAYQMACARFYLGDFPAARAAFTAIAQEGASPWRRLAAYLVGRTWLREGERLSAKDPAGALRCYREAHHVWAGLRGGSMPAKPASAAPEPLGEQDLEEGIRVGEQRALAKADPEAAAGAMLQDLKKPGASDDFGDLVARFTNLLDANITGEADAYETRPASRSIPPGLLKDDLAEWAYRFRETGPKAYALAYQRWKQRHGLPWLLMAIANGEPSSKGIQEVLGAAAALPPENPAYETVSFHRARILAAQGKETEARTLMAGFLNGDPRRTTPSSRNLWRALRMPLARNDAEFLADALRSPAGSYDLGFDEKKRTPSLATWCSGIQSTHPDIRKRLKGIQAPARFIQGDASRVLNLEVPTEVLHALATRKDVPPHLRREWIRAAWVRAVLLDRWDVAARILPDLLEQEPELRPSLEGFAAAPPVEQARQALLTLLRHPGLRWMVFQGINHRTFTEPGEKPLPLRHRDTYLQTCWWPGPGPEGHLSPAVVTENASWTFSFYGPEPHALEQPLFALVGRGPLPVPWLTPDQRARGSQEAKRLLALEEGPDWLASRTLAWAESSPGDPRLPEALHLAVKSGKVGGEKHYNRACFRLLHTRYKRSPWAARTPIHY